MEEAKLRWRGEGGNVAFAELPSTKYCIMYCISTVYVRKLGNTLVNKLSLPCRHEGLL
jgi:hypothetical protein